MKVAFCKSIDVESEVSIDTEDITNALSEQIQEAEERAGNESLNQRQRSFPLGQFLSSVVHCLSAVTDEMIKAMTPENRRMIANALQKQVDRWNN
jgi:hypothetical protein